MDRPSYVVLGRTPIPSTDAHWGRNVSARNADLTGE